MKGNVDGSYMDGSRFSDWEKKMKNYLLFPLIFVCFFLTACSAAGASKADNYNRFTKEETDISSLAGKPVIVQLGANKSKVVYEVIDVDREERPWKLYSYHLESKEFTFLSLEGDAETEEAYLNGCMNASGTLFLIRENEIYIYQENGRLDAIVPFGELDGFDGSMITDCQCDENFIYLTNAGGEFMVLNFGLDILLHERDCMAALCPNAYDKCRLFVTGNGYNGIYYFDTAQKKLVKENTAKGKQEEEGKMFRVSVISGDADYDFYYYDPNQKEDQVVLIGVKNGKEVQILNFADLSIYPGDIQKVSPDGRGGFIVHTYHIDTVNGGIWRCFTLEKADGEKASADTAQKTEINFAGINIPDEFEKVVFDFNQDSDKYTVRYKDYSTDDGGTDTALKKLSLDMTEKGAIDGLLLGNLPKTDFVEKGMLADLSGYFETENGVSKEAFMPCVLKSMTDESGKIYSVYPEFTVKAFLSKDEPDFSGFGQYTDYLNQEKAVFTEQDETALLNRLLVYSGDAFLGKEGGEPSFGDDFKQLLMLIKAQSDSHIVDARQSEFSLIQNNQAFFLPAEIDFPYTYLFYEYLFEGEFYCTNYTVNCPVLQPWITEIGMMEGTDKKEGIYAFLDFLFSEETYIRHFGKIRFPVLKNVFEDKIKEMTATEEYVDRFGKTITPAEFSYSFDDMDVMLGQMTEEQKRALYHLLEEAVYVKPMPTEYLTVIDEEAGLYFEGVESVDEVCENIRNRISIARSE